MFGDSGVNRRILLVDEWRAVRLLGRRVLTSLGFQTREATSGREALEILTSESDISAVLLEWRPQDDPPLLPDQGRTAYHRRPRERLLRPLFRLFRADRRRQRARTDR